MSAVARLYASTVMHMRLAPQRRQFRYRVYSLLLDIDRLESDTAPLRLVSVDRFNLFSVHRRDHGARDGSSLRDWADRRLAAAGRPSAARIMLLSMPRLFGYAFNPLSVYYCYDGDGALQSVIYQVKNTFGDQHAYVLGTEDARDGAPARHMQDKGFFVSPFIGMEQTYRFTLHDPGDRLAIRIRQDGPSGEALIATQSGRALPLTDRSLMRLFLTRPLVSLKVILGIHWEALRLFLKGARFYRYPGADKVVAEPRDAHV